MALSNRFDWLVLTTGNKTETSVGYTTLYGDTAGAYAVISDVPKLLVYELCAWRNRQGDGERIPQACLTKPPSAELRPDQRDDQSLPPYELLDPLVEAYVEGDLSAAELVDVAEELSADAELVHRRDAARRHRRVQAPSVAARSSHHCEELRQRSAHADHELLPLDLQIRRGPRRWSGSAAQ